MCLKSFVFINMKYRFWFASICYFFFFFFPLANIKLPISTRVTQHFRLCLENISPGFFVNPNCKFYLQQWLDNSYYTHFNYTLLKLYGMKKNYVWMTYLDNKQFIGQVYFYRILMPYLTNCTQLLRLQTFEIGYTWLEWLLNVA